MRRSFAIAFAALLSAAAVPALARPVPSPVGPAVAGTRAEAPGEVQSVDWRYRGPPPGYYGRHRGPPPWVGPRYSRGYGPPRHWAPPPRHWGPPRGYHPGYAPGGYYGGPPRHWR